MTCNGTSRRVGLLCVQRETRAHQAKEGLKHTSIHRMRHQLTEQTSRPLVVLATRSAVVLVVGLAGLIHLLLLPEYFAEQFVYGVVFTSVAVFQLGLALLLLVRPGPRVYRVGIWGSGFIALVYVATRLISPETIGPAEINALGFATTGLELVALLLLALTLPDQGTPRPFGAPRWWGLGGAMLTAPLWFIATGIVQWTSAIYTMPLTWFGSWTANTPVLVGSPLPHIWLAAPWWGLPAAAVLAVLVGLNLWLSTRLLIARRLTCRARRVGLLALLPAGLSAPLCCGAPLGALLGIPLLLGAVAAPFAVGLSVVGLLANGVFLRMRLRKE